MNKSVDITYNNITVKYNAKDWNKKQGKTKEVLECVSCSLSVILFILPTVLLGIITGNEFITLFFGLIIGMLNMIGVQALSEKLLFDDTIAGYRLLNWFASYGEKSKAIIQNGKVSIASSVNKEHNIALDRLMLINNLKSEHSFIEGSKNIKDEPFRIEIDTTNGNNVSVKLISEDN